jgi:zinc transport system permease protein
VVTLIRVVGLILVIALLTLPAAIAQQCVRSLGKMMLVATLLGFFFTVSGLAVSYKPDLPTGPTIILIAGLCYLLAVAGRASLKKLRRGRMGREIMNAPATPAPVATREKLK